MPIWISRHSQAAANRLLDIRKNAVLWIAPFIYATPTHLARYLSPRFPVCHALCQLRLVYHRSRLSFATTVHLRVEYMVISSILAHAQGPKRSFRSASIINASTGQNYRYQIYNRSILCTSNCSSRFSIMLWRSSVFRRRILSVTITGCEGLAAQSTLRRRGSVNAMGGNGRKGHTHLVFVGSRWDWGRSTALRS